MPFSKPSVQVKLFICLFLLSCSKVNVTGPAGVAGPAGTAGDSTISGAIYGKVALYDSLGNPFPDNGAATVLLENASPQISVATKSDGSFSVTDAPSGVYNITVSKSGFGSMRIFNFPHAGGKNASHTGMISLGEKLSSWYDIKEFQAEAITLGQSHFMLFTITLAHPQTLPHPQVLLYMNHAPGAVNNNNDYVYRINFYQQNDSTLTYSPFDIDPGHFSDNLYGIDYLYLSAAIDNPKLFSYVDNEGHTVFPASGNRSNEVKVYNNLKN